ncbi:hypothetical protein HanPSC8_Chr09g0361441 [Helianthus annuus]|nr:hypothetical protein HanPSC8_Chr09g0361441 [Helianthus annuus]
MIVEKLAGSLAIKAFTVTTTRRKHVTITFISRHYQRSTDTTTIIIFIAGIHLIHWCVILVSS